MSRRAPWIAALLVTLLLAGVGSSYASSRPDGLEYVAEQAGFLDSAEDSPTADSPFADYGTRGVEDPRIGGGLAGVVGVLVVLLLAGGLAWGLRRRGRAGLDTASPGGSAGSTSEVGSAGSAGSTSEVGSAGSTSEVGSPGGSAGSTGEVGSGGSAGEVGSGGSAGEVGGAGSGPGGRKGS